MQTEFHYGESYRFALSARFRGARSCAAALLSMRSVSVCVYLLHNFHHRERRATIRCLLFQFMYPIDYSNCFHRLCTSPPLFIQFYFISFRPVPGPSIACTAARRGESQRSVALSISMVRAIAAAACRTAFSVPCARRGTSFAKFNEPLAGIGGEKALHFVDSVTTDTWENNRIENDVHN